MLLKVLALHKLEIKCIRSTKNEITKPLYSDTVYDTNVLQFPTVVKISAAFVTNDLTRKS